MFFRPYVSLQSYVFSVIYFFFGICFFMQSYFLLSCFFQSYVFFRSYDFRLYVSFWPFFFSHMFFQSYVFLEFFCFLDCYMFQILYIGVLLVRLFRFQQTSYVLSAFLFVCIMYMLFLKSLILFHANIGKKIIFCINNELYIYIHCINMSRMQMCLEISSMRENTGSHKICSVIA